MAHDDTTPGTQAGSARVHELDVDRARASLHEMAAVVRTIFGVDLDAPLQALEDPQPFVVDDPSDAWTGTAAPVEAPIAESPLTGDAHPVPQTAALTSVPVPSALPVEGIAVTPPGVATPMAASPLPASEHAAAQPGETPAPIPLPAVPAVVPVVVPVPPAPVPLAPEAPVAPVAPAASIAPAATAEPAEDETPDGIPLPDGYPQAPDRHSMALLHEIAFLDD